MDLFFIKRGCGATDKFQGAREDFPFRLAHYSCLKCLGGIVLSDFDCLLHNYLAAVGYLVYEMHRSACDLHAVGKRRLVYAKPVKALSAEGGNQRGVNVDYSSSVA